MAEHTPGPWFTEAATCTIPTTATIAISGPGWSELAAVVTHVEGVSGDEPNAEGEANARLIAEAPAMLEALRTMCDAFGHYCAFGEQSQDEDEALANACTILARIDGTAKARGEA